MQQQPARQQNECVTAMIEWWNAIPFGTKFIFSSTSIICFIDVVFGYPIYDALVDVPALTFAGQFWRVLFCQFVYGLPMVILIARLISLLIGLWMIHQSAIEVEKSFGTVLFLFDMFVKNILIQLTFLGLSFLLSELTPLMPMWLLNIFPHSALYVPSCGLWNTYMIYVSIRSFSNPEQTSQFLCFPLQIKNKYYPLILVFLLNLFFFPYLDIMAACMLGYLEVKFFSGMMVRPSGRIIKCLSNSFLCFLSKSRGDFISYEARSEVHSISNAESGQQVVQSFNEFGGKGVKIGGDPVGPQVAPVDQNYYNNVQVQSEDTQSSNQDQQEIRIDDQIKSKPKNQQYTNLGEELL